MDEHSICYWRCPNCGQVHFGDAPPDMCAYCQDFTTWELIAGDAPETPPDTAQSESSKPKHPHENPARQKRLFD